MNERIKQLISEIDQSNLPYQRGDKLMTGTVRDLEYFAELIVFECIKLAVFKGDAKTGKAIKEHFGVEE